MGGADACVISKKLSFRGLSPESNARHTQSMKAYWTYILARAPRGTLYVGVTNGLIRRVEEHREGTASAFTRRYKIYSLVWFQEFADVREAIQREKTIKDWRRDWKINLIERDNLQWTDLYPTLPGVAPNSRL
jgi:putative endonuclease